MNSRIRAAGLADIDGKLRANERLAFEPDAIAAVKRLREWCGRYRSLDFQNSHERS